jgi:lantibiotic biosynthesis protein
MAQALQRDFRAWHGGAPARLVEASGQIARTIAARLADPSIVATHLLGDVGDRDDGRTGPYDMQTFSHGLPGVIVLHSELDRIAPAEGWDSSANRLIHALADTIQQHGMAMAGLFVGASGQAFAIWSASRGETRYQTLMRRIDAGLLSLAEALLVAAQNRKGNCAVSDYDAMQGLTGIGRYLLHRADNPRLRPIREATFDYLSGLSEPITRKGVAAPGWFVPKEHQMTIDDAAEFPHGNFNSGLAHGIAGPLALLSLAFRAGHRRAGHREAIRRMANWLVDISVGGGEATKWPARISWQAHMDRGPVAVSERNAWCYGVPGIARSLYLAGVALNDPLLSRNALASLRDHLCATRPSKLAMAPTLCHGLTGILQIALRMAADSGDIVIRNAGTRLVEAIVEQYDPTLPLGYRDIEERNDGLVAVSKAGFLNGAAGVALALATYGSIQEPVWDSAMLLS